VALGLPETHFPNDYALTAPDPARRAGVPARYRRALDQYAQDGGDGLIFTSPEGTPMRPGNFTRRVAARDREGGPDLRALPRAAPGSQVATHDRETPAQDNGSSGTEVARDREQDS